MNPFQLVGGAKQRFHGLRGTAAFFHLASQGKKAVVVTASPAQIGSVVAALKTFRPDSRVFPLPALDGSAFSFAPVHPSTRRTRLHCFQAVVENRWDYIVTVPQVFLECLPPRKKLLAPRIDLTVGHSYDLVGLSRQLVDMGYTSLDMVAQPGDFARRGGILDIYSFVDETAYRLEFFDDELEEIRVFDPATQRATTDQEALSVLPIFEWVVGDEELKRFGQRGGQLWNQTKSRDQFLALVAQLADRRRFAGYLHWTGLFFSKCRGLPELLGDDCHFFVDDWDAVQEAQESFLTQFELQSENLGLGADWEQLKHLLFSSKDPHRIPIAATASVASVHSLGTSPVDGDFATQSVPAYRNDVARFTAHWRVQANRLAIVLVCGTDGLLRRLEDMLEEDGLPVRECRFPLTLPMAPGFYLALGPLETGFSWPEKHLVVVSEGDIWSKVAKPKRKPAGKKMFHSEFRDLKTGDYVVHLDHGIGRFMGLVEMEAGGDTHEMMALAYKDNQKLYVHLNQLNLIQRYGSETAKVALDKLGSVTWERTKTKVRKALRELAGELIKLYAARQLVTRPSYGQDTEWQIEFEDAFEYEPTSGQLAAFADIKSDLESEKPMDRLLVGDVGFGKTEVAMRLSFKVVMANRQVAVLCPTTVLAFQHYHSFKNRFASFPLNIQWVSRFRSAAATRKVLRDTAAGKVDILIGTHRLLSKDVQFKKLGSLIVDEEQRFGVAHKEKLKQFRKKVDILSMSATPIPRTLNMSLSGIRDISIIETPPRNRLAICTSVVESRESLIKNAIEFELERGGQVFFIHNRIETMTTVAANLMELVPGARVGTAHGQMDPKAIESVMIAFMNKKVDVLVASTIIENGVDIPNANTMIINRADLFGMSQLYQLRGRIGRSDRPAFAYLLVPPRSRMTSIARKRLAALEEFSDLGSGFRIAAMDLELRGAGNLLGGQQAGHLNAIGFETYMKLLDEEVRKLKGQKMEDEVHCLLKIQIGASLPRTYIEDPNQRLHYYKKLAAAKDEEAVDNIEDTLADVFGPIPEAARLLCEEHRLRTRLAQLKILGVEREGQRLKYRFHEQARVNSEIVLQWIREGRDVNLSPEGVLVVPMEAQTARDILNFVQQTTAHLIG